MTTFQAIAFGLGIETLVTLVVHGRAFVRGHYVGVVWLGLTVAMVLYVTGDLWDKYQRAPHGRVKQFFRLLFFAISGTASWVIFEGPIRWHVDRDIAAFLQKLQRLTL